jgi:antitoxin component YwqK of YwqJK toxin-antitoxin module
MKNLTKISIITLLSIPTFTSIVLSQNLNQYVVNRHEIRLRSLKENYKEGEKNNKWTDYYGKRNWYSNRQISGEGNYTDGKEDGKYTFYHENGKKWEEGNYKGGEYYITNGWNEDGELLIKDGNGKWIWYYGNGQIRKEINYKDGKLDGEWIYYYETGEVEEGNYKGGEYYIINRWNEDGELLIKDGNGKVPFYYENGQILLEEYYKDGKEDGYKEYTYYENGQISLEEYYKDGEKNGKFIFYDENNWIKWVGYYKDGKEDGEWIYYDENEKIIRKGNYKNGEKNGIWTSYFSGICFFCMELGVDGQWYRERKYKDGKLLNYWSNPTSPFPLILSQP